MCGDCMDSVDQGRNADFSVQAASGPRYSSRVGLLQRHSVLAFPAHVPPASRPGRWEATGRESHPTPPDHPGLPVLGVNGLGVVN